jgi:HAD superfamily hydrolase (TIGR01549 family)
MSKFKNIKAIFFDVGDTLYTNEDLEKEYPRQLHKLLVMTKGIDKDQAKQLLKDTTEKLKATEKHVTKVRAMAELGFTRAQVHAAFCKVDPYQFLSKDPELDTVISQLAQQFTLGLISNFKRSHLVQILDALGLKAKQFPLMITEDIVQEIKPALEPFQKAVELAGVKADEVLYVGDSPSKDMRPAKEAGMKTVLVRANPSHEDMKNADASVTSIKEIRSLL